MKRILGLLVICALIGAGCFSSGDSSRSRDSSSSSSSSSSSDDPMTWMPYAFTGTELFEFEVEQTKRGKTAKGFYNIKIGKAGGKYKIDVEGKMGEKSGSFATTANERADVIEKIMAEAMANAWSVPLVATMFDPKIYGWSFLGLSWEVGAKKELKQAGKVTTWAIAKSCEYAGQKGRLLRMSVDGEVTFETCIAKDVALPLYIMKDDEQGDFTVTLKNYKD